MSKIKEIEKLLEYWKAEENKAHKKGWTDLYHQANGGVQVLTSALEILKRPSNTQMHVDTKPCAECEKEKKNYPWPPFCKWCGRALSQ